MKYGSRLTVCPDTRDTPSESKYRRPPMNVAVYTCITGNYLPLPPRIDIPGVDWFAFMDEPVESDAWEVVPLLTRLGDSPRMAAKGPKLLPHNYLPDYETTIWIDGAYVVVKPNFVDEALKCVNESDMAMWVHPERDCIYDEAALSVTLPKYQGVGIEGQIERYRASGHPAHWGLWCGGAMVRRHTAQQEKLGEMWMDEVRNGSVQDQISFPWCLRQLEMPMPGEFPALLGYYGYPWLRHVGFQIGH